MSSFVLDINGDLDITNGKLSFTTGLEAIRQHLAIKLQIAKGEWFLNQEVGVPYFEKIFQKPANFEVVSSVFKTEILETPGVTELLSFEMDFDANTRELSISFKALTEEGILDFSTEIEV